MQYNCIARLADPCSEETLREGVPHATESTQEQSKWMSSGPGSVDYLPGFTGSGGIVALDLLGQHGFLSAVVRCVLCRKASEFASEGGLKA